MTRREKIIEKVQNLLNLSKSDNVNEAALAARRAQEMIERHRIEQAELDRMRQEQAQQGIGDIRIHMIHKTGKMYNWQHILASALAEANYCRYMVNQEAGHMLVAGTHEDALMVHWLFQVYTNEIRELFEGMYRYNHPLVLQHAGVSNKRKARNSFFLGAAVAIGERIKEARERARDEARQTTEAGLVCINESIATLDQHEQRVQKFSEGIASERQNRKIEYNPHAFAAGQRAGAQVDIDRNRPVEDR